MEENMNAIHPKYGECVVVSIHEGIATIGIDTVSEAGPYEEDQSLCYGMEYREVPLNELTAI